MIPALRRYRKAVEHEHGWDVELTCGACSVGGMPCYKGWTPSHADGGGFGKTPKVYADLTCPNCGADLREEAKAKLVRLFADQTLPAANRRYIRRFVGTMIAICLGLPALLFVGTTVGWWGFEAFLLLTLLAFLSGPAILFFNYKIASLRQTCACGAPRYIFMGLLGRSYCYRCRTCGQPLRMRD